MQMEKRPSPSIHANVSPPNHIHILSILQNLSRARALPPRKFKNPSFGELTSRLHGTHLSRAVKRWPLVSARVLLSPFDPRPSGYAHSHQSISVSLPLQAINYDYESISFVLMLKILLTPLCVKKSWDYD